jgi:hypothetical protein
MSPQPCCGYMVRYDQEKHPLAVLATGRWGMPIVCLTLVSAIDLGFRTEVLHVLKVAGTIHLFRREGL